MEILNRREQIGAKKLPPVIGDDVEKASKSKFGVVKIGDGINVSSGVISVPNSGFTEETLFDEGETPVALAANATVTLAHGYSDYKMLCVVLRRSDTPTNGYAPNFFSTALTLPQFVPYISMTGVALYGIILNSETPTTLTITDATNTTNMFISKVIGYK